MKYILILLAIVAGVFADHTHDWTPKTPEEIKTIRTTCMEETSLTDEQKKALNHFELPDDDNVHKYVLCTATKIGLFCTDEGTYDADRIAKQFKINMDEDEAKKIVVECITEHPKGDKENAIHVYEVNKCLMATDIGKNIKKYVKEHEHDHEHEHKHEHEHEHEHTT